jgi:predicted nucleotidyltransferase component of viral defense system
LSVELNHELCVDVAEVLGLPHPGLVEKDWHVVRALRALSPLSFEGSTLAFGGGTSLCRAYGMIRRMSEDIDLRVAPPLPSRPSRRGLRGRITEALLAAGFEFDSNDEAHLSANNEGRSLVYNLPYAPVSARVASLRPGVKVEICSSPLLLPTVPKAIRSYVAEAMGLPPELEGVLCVAVDETAAEKFVALTRRIAAEHAAGSERDHTLLRHVYDLHELRGGLDLPRLRPLLRDVLEREGASRGGSPPDYRDDPAGVSRAAIKLLGEDRHYARDFEIFLRDMVYGHKPAFDECLETLGVLSGLLIE